MSERLLGTHMDTIQALAQGAVSEAHQIEDFSQLSQDSALYEAARLAVVKTLEALDRADLFDDHFTSSPESFARAVLSPEAYEDPAVPGNVVQPRVDEYEVHENGLGVAGLHQAAHQSQHALESQGRM